MSRIRFLSTLGFDDDWLIRLRAAVPDVDIAQVTAEKVDDVPAAVWRTVDVLHTSAVFPEPADAPALRWVQLDTSGADHVRDHAIWHSGVPITTIGGISPVPLAEFVLWAILGSAHRMSRMLQAQQARQWPGPDERWQRFLPLSLAGSTVAILGYGRIGREIGRLARAHGMTVLGITRTGRARTAAEQALLADFVPRVDDDEVEISGPGQLHELLGRADYSVVVMPLTEQSRNLIDADAVAAMKPGSVLINVARGGIVDEAALSAALRSGALGGAVLDVFDDEPLAPDSPWWSEPNTFVTPHVSGLAPRYPEQVLELVTTNLRRFLAGQPLLNVIDRSRGY